MEGVMSVVRVQSAYLCVFGLSDRVGARATPGRSDVKLPSNSPQASYALIGKKPARFHQRHLMPL
jgi:hypothetical protein